MHKAYVDEEFGLVWRKWPGLHRALTSTLESLWAKLEQILQASLHFPTSVPDLTNTLAEEWSNITSTILITAKNGMLLKYMHV